MLPACRRPRPSSSKVFVQVHSPQQRGWDLKNVMGDVLVTKFPALHPGDLRLLKVLWA